MSIEKLPSDVIAQIKSSIAITNLNGVVCELVKNALDASATKIDVSVNYARGGCVVEDNGLGIPPTEFCDAGGLGKLYHSSKLDSTSPVHGGRGVFIASLSSLALLSITSHHHLHFSHNTIDMHKSEIVGRHTPAPALHSLPYRDHGTRVTVRDLFGNMPVRVKQRVLDAEKQRANDKDWEQLRRSIAALLLSWPRSIAITIREVGTLQKISVSPSLYSQSHEPAPNSIDIPRICHILHQMSFIYPAEKQPWIEVKASTDTLSISGGISLEPHATKQVQFLSFGVQPIMSFDGQSILHDEINRLFLNSSFGSEEEVEDLVESEMLRRANDARYKSDGYTTKELKGGKKGVDRWPMFYMNIQQLGDLCFDVDDVLDDKANSLNKILELVRVTIIEFLAQHHFRPKAGRQSRHKATGEIAQTHLTPEKSTVQSESTSKYVMGIPRSTSAPPMSAEKHSKSEKSKSKPMHLDSSNIKFPSFRRSSSQLDSPFDSWSKIKRGAVAPKFDVAADAKHLPRPATASPARSRHRATPLISKDGKITRPPFDDVDATTPTSRPQLQQKRTNITAGDGDELIEWMDPITKVRCLVNQRTGLTVIADKSSLHDKTIATSQGPRYSRENLKRIADASSNRRRPPSANLQTWENPVFKPSEPAIARISIDGIDDTTTSILHNCQHRCTPFDIEKAFKDVDAGVKGRISKNDLRGAKVISQVDKKFILVKLQGQSIPPGSDGTLVIVDQHAADERIRVEKLMEELCSPPQSTSPIESKITTTALEKPLMFDLSVKEIELLKTHRAHFAEWGILYDSPQVPAETGTQHIQVRYLPPGIIERCKLEPRLLIELIRSEAWKCAERGHARLPAHNDRHEWVHRIHNCPQQIVDMLNSRACRSAIMFNDDLSIEQCETLIRRLADCVFPFQCAHGRPSLVPLVDMGRLQMGNGDGLAKEKSFGVVFNTWSNSRAPSR